MKMRNENDLRAWLRGVYPPDDISGPYWIEPAPGSTPGLPDCFVSITDAEQVYLELKFAEARKEEYRISFRPDQKRLFPRLLAGGVKLGLLVTLPTDGGFKIVLARPTPEILAGRILRSREETDYFNLPLAINKTDFHRLLRMKISYYEGLD